MSVTIQFDYTYDNTGFFAPGTAARAILEQAGSYIGGHLNDHLAAIPGNPGAGNTWSAKPFDPRDISSTLNITNLAVPADTIIVYAGASALPSGMTGKGGTGYSSSGDAGWNQLIASRGQFASPTTGLPDIGPWGGSITFSTQTQFSFTPMGTPSGSSGTDFLATALHELGHVLGLLPVSSDYGYVDPTDNVFLGSHSYASYGGPVPLDPSGTHWADGTQSFGEDAIMTASVGTYPQGAKYTSLDWAALEDAGWETDTLSINTPPPSNVTFGTPFGLSVAAVDPNGRVDKAYDGTITLSLANNPGGGTLGGTLTVQAVQGIATFTGLTLSQVGTGYTIRATANDDTPAVTTAPFSVVQTSSAATHLAISVPTTSPKTLEAFGITVTALDVNGNVDPNYSGPITLSLATNPGNATLRGTLTVQAVNGVATFGVTLDKAASGYQFQASASGLPAATSSAMTVKPAATQLAFSTLPPSGLRTMVGFSVKVQAKDISGNLDPNYSGPVTLSLYSGPSGGILGGTLTVQAVDGVATFTGLTLNKEGTYRIQASAAGLSAGYASAYANHAATHLAITTQPPSSVRPNEGFTMVATALDANGNLDPNYSGPVTARLVANPGNGRLGQTGEVTVQAVNGIATFTGLTLNKPGVGYTISVSWYTGPSSPASTPITVASAGTQLAITTPPPGYVKTATGFSLTVTVKDVNGDRDTFFSGLVTLSLAANPGAGMLGGTLSVYAVQGVATFAGLTLNKPASGYLIQATAAGMTSATSSSITALTAAPQLSITTQPPSSVRSGETFSLTARVLDANGNFDPSYSGLVRVSLLDNPGGGTLGGTLTVQAVNGIATFTGLSLDKPAAGYTIRVSTTDPMFPATSTSITVIPASPYLAITMPSTTVWTALNFSLTVTAKDANGNLDPNYSGWVTLSLVANPGSGQLGGLLRVRAIQGVATFTGLTLNKPASGYLIQATASGMTSTVSPAITVIPAATQLSVINQPSGDVKTGQAFIVTVAAKDANGNLDVNYTGPVTLSLAANPGAGMLSGTLTVYAVHGVALFTGLSLNKSASGYLIKASASGMTSATTSAITVTPAATQLAITAQPPSNVKTGEGFSLTVNALDANGNLDPNYAGYITLSLAANPGAGMLSGTLSAWAVHGVATFTGVSLNKPASGYLIKASSGGLTAATSSAIAVTPAATQLAFTAQPPSTVKVGVPFSLTVTAKDANGNLDPNYSGIITIGLAANPGAGMVSGTLNVQAVHGVATFTDLVLNKPAVGYLIKATATGLTLAMSSSITATTA